MAVTRPVSAPTPRANLKQEVAQYVRDLILSGAVHSGQRIDQDGIADQLGVSRLPVREALITLEAEGLVDNIARRGSFVASLAPDDITDHYEMYGLLSGLAAGRVARVHDSELVGKLEEIQQEMRATQDPLEHDALNFAFHQAINKAGSSRRLRSVLRTLSHNMPTSFFSQSVEWGWKQRAIDEHDLIIAALRSHDDSAAAEAVVEHFRHTGAQAVHILEEQGFWRKERDIDSQEFPLG